MSKFSETTPDVRVSLLATAFISILPAAMRGMTPNQKQSYLEFVLGQIGTTEQEFMALLDQNTNMNATLAAAIVDECEAAFKKGKHTNTRH
ncbi:hypothetical protein HOT49_gp267 [Erwinia phage vB_EamM_Alexandra]|uniref:Uncharacterized protein n=1 Tax=Erwinia phage vB_EamM_Alexandra TaxID=2201424 RepID=A0A2Z4QFM7_9CAUD|nr:hypothetical protein HOT49_gp267 [Erwinia phage vB_EamM_Alexandra]AWY08526.1 hypothetical protein Alexandra_269 [Erwinia phage vB_EamM_Alexandra]